MQFHQDHVHTTEAIIHQRRRDWLILWQRSI